MPISIKNNPNLKPEALLPQEASSEISAILEAARSVLKYHTFKDAAQSIFNFCKNLIGATAGYIALLSADGTRNEVLFLDAGGLPCTVNPELPMPIRGLRAEAYNLKHPVFDNNFPNSKWQKYMPRGHVVLKNVLFAPLFYEGNAIGLFGLANKSTDFNEHDVNLAAIFAEIAAIALKNSHLIESCEISENKYRNAYELSDFYKDFLSHDINNIFQAIFSTIELYPKIAAKDHSEKPLEETFTRIKTQIMNGVMLISTIHKLSQLEEKPIELERVDISEVLKSAVEFIDSSFKQKKIEIQITQSEKDSFVNANSILLEVFENILHNSVKYNKSPKIEIQVNIFRQVSEELQYLRLEFADNGIGIADDRKASIFQKKQQAGTITGGMGIGLSLIKKAVESYGGNVWIEDRIPGDYSKGSKFVLLLPLSA